MAIPISLLREHMLVHTQRDFDFLNMVMDKFSNMDYFILVQKR